MRNVVAAAMSPHDDKSFHNELPNNDQGTMTTNIITNIPMVPKWWRHIATYKPYNLPSIRLQTTHPAPDDVNVDQQRSQLQILIVAVLQRDRSITWHHKHTGRQVVSKLPTPMHPPPLPPLAKSNERVTGLEAFNGEGGLCQEVEVVEHVHLVDHEAQEGEGRVADGEPERFARPCGVQSIVSWKPMGGGK